MNLTPTVGRGSAYVYYSGMQVNTHGASEED